MPRHSFFCYCARCEYRHPLKFPHQPMSPCASSDQEAKSDSTNCACEDNGTSTRPAPRDIGGGTTCQFSLVLDQLKDKPIARPTCCPSCLDQPNGRHGRLSRGLHVVRSDKCSRSRDGCLHDVLRSVAHGENESDPYHGNACARSLAHLARLIRLKWQWAHATLEKAGVRQTHMAVKHGDSAIAEDA